MVKIWTKQPWLKIENLRDFDRDFALSRGKIWLWLFYNFFLRYGSTILHKKFQVISNKNEGVTAIYTIFEFLKKFFQSLKFKVWTL